MKRKIIGKVSFIGALLLLLAIFVFIGWFVTAVVLQVDFPNLMAGIKFASDCPTISLDRETINQTIESTILFEGTVDKKKDIWGEDCYIMGTVARGVIVEDNKGERYILTAGHVFPLGKEFYLVKINRSGHITYSLQGPAVPLLAVDQEVDFAIVDHQFLGLWEPDTSYLEIGNSDELKPGATIYYVGFKNDTGEKILKRGEITSVRSSEVKFISSQPFFNGESGAPVLALKDGKFVVVGVFFAKAELGSTGEERGVFCPINYIVSIVQKELGIDLRK